MKRGYILAVIGCMLISSCNKEWQDELFRKSVSFVNNGVVEVHVKYNAAGGAIPVKVPIIVSGSTENSAEVTVTINTDVDTLQNLNFERFRLRSDLYFNELPKEAYQFESMNTTIPAGKNQGSYNLNLKLAGLDFSNKYILPVQIISTSSLAIATGRGYKKSLMRIVPFNDYSGKYSIAAEVWDRNRPQNEQKPLTVPFRNAYVVDEKTVFFFAGVTEEEALDRREYKIKASFNEGNKTVTLSSENPAIRFSQQRGTFTVKKEKDGVLPYLERIYTTVFLEYQYSDISNPTFPIDYRFVGSMILERKRNTLIPDEDQQGTIIIP
ncbi:hypothetical protein AQ505_20010 [Pedobacter sp. PACM 27299]|uniref:DUF4973 domain-containing protein n=1 Tax=Pedobacter sp. PACM 27299 TaxID=1727164 RepID=UPI0007069C1A|nr:DUF4973 domain-containing protein [Pedobacter sp. PACM 27299]ALL07575.1 hypothetical protein AQ505_20010 [Pedobacter sp. PACM 27299]